MGPISAYYKIPRGRVLAVWYHSATWIALSRALTIMLCLNLNVYCFHVRPYVPLSVVDCSSGVVDLRWPGPWVCFIKDAAERRPRRSQRVCVSRFWQFHKIGISVADAWEIMNTCIMTHDLLAGWGAWLSTLEGRMTFLDCGLVWSRPLLCLYVFSVDFSLVARLS